MLRLVLAFLLPCLVSAYAQEVSVVVKMDIECHDGSPYTGALTVRPLGKKGRVKGHSNSYGLAFIPLSPNAEYSISFPGFPDLSRFKTPAASQREMSLQIRLPEDKLKGIPFAQGRGVVLFTYQDTVGHSRPGEELVCRDERGKVYRKRTEQDGTLRLELPLAHTYTFSVRGAKNFSRHSFGPEPLLQTAELELKLGNIQKIRALRKKRKSKRERRDAFMRERIVPVTTKPLATRRDSLGYARRSIRAASRGKRFRALVVPPRKIPKPKVTKRVVEGVYLMKQAYAEANRKDRNIGQKIRMELFRPLLRSNFQDVVFVIDVTCSMDPYLEEYLLWLSLARNSSRVMGCVFFNDGDGRTSKQKPLGHTGGIRVSSSNMDSTAKALVESIAYGCSGDDAENDLEALLFAQWRFPNAKALVLIADNTSAVRDISLYPKLQKPVHVFLCGAEVGNTKNPPHEDYVTIAASTGGSLHSLSEDIERRKLQLTSQQIWLGKWEYLLLKGRFRRLN